jgi:hypothetical protein
VAAQDRPLGAAQRSIVRPVREPMLDDDQLAARIAGGLEHIRVREQVRSVFAIGSELCKQRSVDDHTSRSITARVEKARSDPATLLPTLVGTTSAANTRASPRQ